MKKKPKIIEELENRALLFFDFEGVDSEFRQSMWVAKVPYIHLVEIQVLARSQLPMRLIADDEYIQIRIYLDCYKENKKK